MDKEADKRVLQAFTFGLKLNKHHQPDQLKLFDSLTKIVKNHERLGITKEKSNKMRTQALKAEANFKKYRPDRTEVLVPSMMNSKRSTFKLSTGLKKGTSLLLQPNRVVQRHGTVVSSAPVCNPKAPRR